MSNNNFVDQFKGFMLSQPNPPSKSTVKNYISDINKFIRWFENKLNKDFAARDVNQSLIKSFRQDSLDRYSASSVDRSLSSLRKFFHFLKLEGQISHSPFEIGNLKLEIEKDPWRIRDFKNHLYVFNASHLTIKNYIIDVRQFLTWAEKVLADQNSWIVSNESPFSSLTSELIDEYKKRLLNLVRLSPVSVNRKMSSIRRYLAWAQDEGLLRQKPEISNIKYQILNNQGVVSAGDPRRAPAVRPLADEDVGRGKSETGPRDYSKFPPFRVIQKSTKGLVGLFDNLLIYPLSDLLEILEQFAWRLRGKPVFKQAISGFRIPKFKIVNPKEILNVPKSFYDPAHISTKYLPLHRKIWHHARNTRPKWYKKYHSYSFVSYLHFSILMLFISAMGYFLFNTFSPQKQTPTFAAIPSAPPRILSFQGRLTDSSGNPITNKTALRMGIYNNSTASGSALLWQEIVSPTPDNDGIFSVILGRNTPIPQTLFAQNSALWLGVTVRQTPELKPRQQIATVAFAANAETLQGLPPITNTTATANVVLALNSSGNLTIGGSASPTFQATGGTFTLAGQTLVLTTNASSNGNIILNPDGTGIIDLQKPLQNTSNNGKVIPGAVEVHDLFVILATTSSHAAFNINQNGTNNLITASKSGVVKFFVGNSGSIYGGGNLEIDGDSNDIAGTLNLSGNTLTSSSNLTINATGYVRIGDSATPTTASGDDDLFVEGDLEVGSTATISGNLTLAGGARSIQTTANNTLTIGGATTGNITISPLNGATGSFLAPNTNNQVDLGTSSLAFRNIYVNNVIGGSSGTQGFWQRNSQALSPTNITDDVLLGAISTASAKFGFLNVAGGTPTASISANSGNNATYLTGSGSLQTVLNNTLTLGGNTTGNITLAPNDGGSDGTVTITGQTLATDQTSFNLINTGATTLNFAGTATSLTIGATSGSVDLRNPTINVGGGSAATITTVSDDNLTLTAQGSGEITLTSDFDSGVNIGTSSNTPAPLSVSGGIGGNAATIINQANSGDIFSASASGTTRFTIANDGDLTLAGGNVITASSLDTFTTAATLGMASTTTLNLGTGASLTSAGTDLNLQTDGAVDVNIAGGSSATGCTVANSSGNITCSGNFISNTTTGTQGHWNVSQGAIFPRLASTLDLLIGGTSTTSAKFGVLNVDSGTPTASISANSGNIATYLTGDGNLQTTNGQTLTLGGTTTGLVNVNNKSGSAFTTFDTVNSRAGIGTTSPGARLHSVVTDSTSPLIAERTGANAVKFQVDVGGNHLGLIQNSLGQSWISGANNNVGYTISESNAFGTNDYLTVARTTGNVGIGTTAPTAKLDVAGAASVGGQLTFRSGSGTIQTTAGETLVLGGTTTGLVNINNKSGSAFTTFDTVNSRVGIGTTAPGKRLSVVRAADADGIQVRSDVATLNHTAEIGFRMTTTEGVNTAGMRAIRTNAPSALSTDLQFFANLGATDVMRLTADGNVGIGTTTPTALLDVAGAASVGGQLTFRSGTAQIQSTARQTLSLGGNTTGLINVLDSAGSAFTTFDTVNSRIGLGTATPDILLHLVDTGSQNYRLGDITAGTSTTDGGLLMDGGRSDRSGGIFTEVLGDILSYGINVPQITTRDTARAGAIFRIDTRVPGGFSNASVFVVKRYAIGSSTEQNAFVIDLNNGDTFLSPITGGKAAIGHTATPSATLHISGGQWGGNAAMIVNQAGASTNDIFTASASGTTRFTIANDGDLTLAGGNVITASSLDTFTTAATLGMASTTTLNLGTSATINAGATALNLQADGSIDVNIAGGSGSTGCTITNSNGNLTCSGNIVGSTTGISGFWQRTAGSLAPTNISDDLLLGATSTASAKIALLNVAGGTPTASISANSGNNATTLSGLGVLGTTNMQTLTVGNSTTGNLSFNSAGTTAMTILPSGNVGIGTTTPRVSLQIGSGTSFQTTRTGLEVWQLSTVNDAVGNLNIYSTDALAIDKGGSIGFGGSNAAIDPYMYAKIAGRSEAGTGYAGYLQFLTTNAASTVGEKMRITSTGSVGINTTSPTAVLDVAGAASVGGQLTFRSGSGTIQTTANQTLTIGGNTTGNIVLSLGTNEIAQLNDGSAASAIWGTNIGFISEASQARITTNSSAPLVFFTGGTLNSMTEGTERMRLLNSGEFGIGTTPVSQLHVTRPLSFGATGKALAIFDQIENQDILTASASGTTRFVVTNAGNVGIGDTSPDATLEINASANPAIRISEGGDDNSYLHISDDSATQAQINKYTQTGAMQLDINAIPSDGVSNGYVRINRSANTSGLSGLQVFKGDGTATQNIFLSGNSNSYLNADSGNVGIGDTTPDAKLEVLSTTEQLRLTHTDNTIDARFTLDSSGNLTIDASTDGTGSETLTLTGFSTLTATSLTTLSLGTSATINAGATALNLQADGAIDVNIAGGSGSTGCTVANSTGNLTCSGNIVGSTTGISGFWQRASGALAPTNISDDLLLGATSTASAKIALLNVAGGTPTASISANSGNNATYLTGDGTLATTNRQTLTIGNSSTYNTTGNVLLQSNGQGRVGIGTTSPSDLLDVQGSIRLSASGVTRHVVLAESVVSSAGQAFYIDPKPVTSSDASLVVLFRNTDANTNTGLRIHTADNTSTINTFLAARGSSYLNANTGNVAIGTDTPTAKLDVAGAASVGGQLTFRSGSGTIQTTAGETLVLGGTTTGNITLSPNNGSGGILSLNTPTINTNATSLNLFTANATTINLGDAVGSGGINLAGGSASTGCTLDGSTGNFTCSGNILSTSTTGTQGHWDVVNGAIFPRLASTLDLLIGGTSTTSAKFAVLNVNSGTPTATVSGNLVVMPDNGDGGRLLIGRTSSTALLDVNRPNGVFGSSNPLLRLTYATSNTVLNTYVQGSGSLIMENLYADKNILLNPTGGNIGIGNTSPTAVLDVAGAASVGGQLTFRSGTAQIQSTVNQTLTIGGNTTGYIVLSPLNNTGKVGINGNPAATTMALEVGGTHTAAATGAVIARITGTLNTDQADNRGFGAQSTFNPTASLSTIRGALLLPTINSSNMTVTDASAVDARVDLGANFSGIVTNGFGYRALAPSDTGAGAFVNYYGLQVSAQTVATNSAGIAVGNAASSGNNVNLLLGTTTIPSGDFSLYSSSSYDSYFAGNVGIGDSTPDSIFSAVGADPILIVRDTDTSLTTANARIRLAESGASDVLDNYWDIGGGIAGTSRFQDLSFNFLTTPLMTVQSSGNVGIGTASGAFRLNVFGPTGNSNTGILALSGGIGSGGTPVLRMGVENGSTAYSWIQSHGALPLRINELGNNVIFNLNAGNVGIGTTTPRSALDVVASTTATSSAFIENSTTTAASVGLTIKMGATTPDTTTHLVNFLDQSGRIRGNIRFANTTTVAYQTSGIADFAEYMKKDPNQNIPWGSILCVDTNGNVYPCTSGSSNIIGVASENPTFVGGEDLGNGSITVGLTGIVPTLISNSNGNIVSGDYITYSGISGIGIKATKAGQIVGIALENYNSSTPGKILVRVGPSWHDPDVYLTDAGNLSIVSSSMYQELGIDPDTLNTEYSILNTATGQAVARIGAFAEVVSGKIRSGSAEIYNLTSISLTSLSGNIGSLTTNTAVFATDNITIAGENIRDFIAGIVDERLASRLQGDALEAQIATNIISPLSDAQDGKIAVKLNDNEGKSKFEIKNASDSAVATLDSEGNASFSGKLSADSGQFNNLTIKQLNNSGDASISGTLRASRIIADQIELSEEALLSLLGLEPQSSTSSYLVNNYYNSSYSSATDSAQVNGQWSMVNGQSISTGSGVFENLFAKTATFEQGFMSFGPASFFEVSIADRLFVGAQLSLADRSINVLGGNLELQPLKQGGIAFVGGEVEIDTDGNLRVNGNANFAKDVEIQGRLFANIISPLPGKNIVLEFDEEPSESSQIRNSKFEVRNSSKSAVLTINRSGDLSASGAGTFSKLNLNIVNEALAVSVTEVIATGSAGTAQIQPNRNELTIRNPLVTENSLIYITPKTSTPAQNLYLLRQVPENPNIPGTEGSFTVGISQPVNKKVPFNWIIIN